TTSADMRRRAAGPGRGRLSYWAKASTSSSSVATSSERMGRTVTSLGSPLTLVAPYPRQSAWLLQRPFVELPRELPGRAARLAGAHPDRPRAPDAWAGPTLLPRPTVEGGFCGPGASASTAPLAQGGSERASRWRRGRKR